MPAKSVDRRPRESEILTAIQLEASRLGHRLFRNNVGVAKTNGGYTVRYGLTPGASDLIGWSKGGRFLAIEVKSSTGVASRRQIQFIEEVNRAGGIGAVCRSVEEFRATMDQAQTQAWVSVNGGVGHARAGSL